ncbi:MAG TPA: hypothetical protein VFB12_17865 [Ktedonobacteraceae bacterium]|nr:hypothetical protein [Ktedonobacteraceae bacterium]
MNKRTRPFALFFVLGLLTGIAIGLTHQLLIIIVVSVAGCVALVWLLVELARGKVRAIKRPLPPLKVKRNRRRAAAGK